MENEEVTRVLSPKAKRIIAVILAVALLAGGGYLWWFLANYRFYTAYKSIVEAPEEYTVSPLRLSYTATSAVSGFIYSAAPSFSAASL